MIGWRGYSPPANHGAALLRGLFNQLACEAGELVVFETQRRWNVIGALTTVPAKGFGEAFDKRARPFIFSPNILLRNMLLGGNGVDKLLNPGPAR